MQWEASDNSQGASYYDHVMPFGTGGKVFVSSHFNTPFSVAGSYDASITRFYDNLIWDAAFVSVGFPGDDNNQEVALTNDESVVVVGFMTMPGMGGSSVYVYKVGPNADFPLINYSDITANDIHSLVTINEVETEIKGLRVYPNPTSSLINFQTIVPLSLHVVDINGRLIENYSIENGSTLDTTHWLKGLYYLSLSDEDGHSKHIKLIVQ